MQIKNPDKRLNKFYGKVDAKHINLILEHVAGKDVLDMGSGSGTTTAQLTKLGFNCTGFDFDTNAVERAKKLWPGCNFVVANAEKLPFPDKSFDTVILRDALHHFYQEADFNKVKTEILRVSRDKSTLIFFDPNVNLMLKTMRKLSSHDDAECNYESALQVMKELNFKVTYDSFNTLFSLPLSGGYVGLNFVPNVAFIQSAILGTERIAEKLTNGLKMGRYACWRYIIVGKRG
jgi:SAM-dependent methyltransferase